MPEAASEMSPTLVVDAAVDLPPGLRASGEVRVVAQEVWAGDQLFEGSTAEFWAALRAGQHFSTTPPSVNALADAYRSGGEVCAVHVSGELSVTVSRAREAAGRSAAPVAVVDSRSLSVGAGLVAFLVHQAARAASSWAELAEIVPRSAERVHTFALVADLGPLRRSERIRFPHSAHLRLHPEHPVLLALRGRAVALEHPRDRVAGLRDLVRHARGSTDDAPAGWTMGHGDARDADALRARLAESFGRDAMYSCPIDPIVGAHLGPDAVVVGVYC